ncbi:hypothetical protein MBANPS3_001840 [Mucor bainieri]
MITGTTEASLPAELWMEIFEKVNSFTQLIRCSMVSTRWKQLAETVMFNRRDITLVTEMDAITFYNYLIQHGGQSNPPIRHLTMTFSGSVDGTLFFKVLLYETFGKKGLPKFKNLKTIPSAWTYCNIYDSLLNRLRYTLQEITLNFRGIYYDLFLKWKTLYRLDKITRLHTLTFNSYVHDVKETEAILQKCGHLKQLTIHLAVEDLFNGEADINQWIEINTRQCDQLKQLRIKIDTTYHPHFIDYLMFKYPSIESIVVEKISIREPWGHYPTTPMDISSIKSVLSKIKRVPKYTLKCKVLGSEEDIIIKSLKSDGYVVFRSYQDVLTPIVTATNISSNHSTQSSAYHSNAPPSPLRIRYPSVLDRPFEL